MTRMQLLGLVVLAAGCAKQMPVAVSLMSPAQTRFDGEIRPRWFEMQHEKEGWIRVEVDEGMRNVDAALDKGVEVPVASGEVPKGRYEKIRFAYVLVRTPPPMAPEVPASDAAISGSRENGYEGGISGSREGAGATTEAPAPIKEDGEVVLEQPFCLDGGDGEQIVVEISRDEGALGAAPRFTLKAPGC